MRYSAREREVILLRAVTEIINSAVNFEVLLIGGEYPNTEVRFKTLTHQKYFNIVMVDFLSPLDRTVVPTGGTFIDGLEAICSDPQFEPRADGHTRGVGVSLEVFDRRVPIYRDTIAFIRVVMKGRELSLEPIFKFATQTDEAVFLFDDPLAEYLVELYRRAVRPHTVYAMSEPPARRTPELSREWSESMLWFSEQFEAARRRFAPYLRLGNAAVHR